MLWRGAIIGILALWIMVGVAYGPTAALVFGFPVLMGSALTVGVIFGGRTTRNFADWYYARQLRGHRR